MKMVNRLFYSLALAFVCIFAPKLCAQEGKSLLAPYNFSIWSEYKRNHFEGMTQAEKTEKLQLIFQDKVNFVKKHGIRRLIVKVLNPVSFDFFHPENFDSEKDDNFFYWASLLSNYVEIEILFDCGKFQLCRDSLFDHLTNYYGSLKDYFGKQENPFGHFENIIEKMEWIAWTSEIYSQEERTFPLFAGITLDAKGIGNLEEYCQNLVNAFDQFRYQSVSGAHVPEWIPHSVAIPKRIGMLLPLDMKDFALANAAPFPLASHLRKTQAGNIGIRLPQNFPSKAPDYRPPVWRSPTNTSALLDTVYLMASDPRLIPHVYQNYDILPKPDQPTTNPVIGQLVDNLEKNFLGIPYVKGPGFITNHKGTSDVSGNYTFFRTGGSHGEGQFISGQLIEIRPPYAPEVITRVVDGIPHSNRIMKLSSTFSTTHSFENAEYWHTAIPCNWTTPCLSNSVISSLYFVFSTDYESKGPRYFGNWRINNFLSFTIYHVKDNGIIHRKIFRNLNGKLVKPLNNLVIHDYSTIPNGDPFPECDWGLGNQNH